MRQPFPWGFIQYLWCRFVHLALERMPTYSIKEGYRCSKCERWHFFDGGN